MPLSDLLLKIIPGITPPSRDLSRQERLKWTAAVVVGYLALFFIPVFGLLAPSNAQISSTTSYSLVDSGLGALEFSFVIMLLFNGSRLFKFDQEDALGRVKFYASKKFIAIIALLILSVVNALLVSVSPSVGYLGIIVQFILGGLFVLYLDEVEVKYGIMGSGLLLFLAIGILHTIASFTLNIAGVAAFNIAILGGAVAIPNEIQSFIPVLITVALVAAMIKIYDRPIGKTFTALIERDTDWHNPINRIFTIVLPLYLAALLLSFIHLLPASFLTSSASNVANFIGHYTPHSSSLGNNFTYYALDGGLIYLINPVFPLPYPAPYGIGGYSTYISYLVTDASKLTLPFGQILSIPELVHVLTYLISYALLTLLFGKILIRGTHVKKELIEDRLKKIYGDKTPSEKNALSAIDKDLVLLGLIVGLSIVSGGIPSNILAVIESISLYVCYDKIYKN